MKKAFFLVLLFAAAIFCVSFRKSPAPGPRFTNQDYAKHLTELRKKIPDANFTFVIQKPFVVIGNEKPDVVKKRALETVKWAVDKLKAEYFTYDPVYIVDIWLFKNDVDYRRYAKEIFNEIPTSPYGYVLPSDHSLIMNIATGGGTLVHEIVHPFLGANFPDCPAWFNEGLASLYEQSEEKDGRIVGLTNWRLSGLQARIKSGKLPSFETLCNSGTKFYSQDSLYSDNYAQARYLCYFLQEAGLLKKYYQQFVANSKTDPTGYQTLQKILGIKDMKKFQTDWQNWVLKLSFQN